MTIKLNSRRESAAKNYERSFHGFAESKHELAMPMLSRKIVRCFRAIRFYDLTKLKLPFANANCEKGKFSFFEKKTCTDFVGSF
jgi:hypothetical protein